MSIRIECIIDDERWKDLDLESLARRVADATADFLSVSDRDYEAALLATNDAKISELNTRFRNKSAPTNVLSWPAAAPKTRIPGQRPPVPDGPEIGDIALARETCVREAAALPWGVKVHVSHLIVHGILHLFGFDHEDDLDADLMERAESAILTSIDMPDPHA